MECVNMQSRGRVHNYRVGVVQSRSCLTKYRSQAGDYSNSPWFVRIDKGEWALLKGSEAGPGVVRPKVHGAPVAADNDGDKYRSGNYIWQHMLHTSTLHISL